jgi:hypothetical protein
MRTSSTTTFTGAVLTTRLLAVSAFAHDPRPEWHPDSGTHPGRFAGQSVIQTGTVTINERDRDITASCKFRTASENK